MRRHVIVAASLFALAPAATRAQSPEALIGRAQAAWARIATLRASFEQTVTNPLTGSAMTTHGELQQAKPDRLAITFDEPTGDRIVADGRYVWIYLPSATPGQVFRMDASAAMAANTDLIGQFLVAPRSRYDITEAGTDTIDGHAARALVLTARPGASLPFVRAKVWIDGDDALIRQFEATDANGITRRVRITSMRPNVPVERAQFAFTVPAGVRVVER